MMKASTFMEHIDQIEPVARGFVAQLRAANLVDLVQMECLSLSHRAVKVTTAHDVGYLFFSGGQMVHASVNQLTGEAAALEILSWDDGSFDSSDCAWPKEESISCDWHSLVMHAAHKRDERLAGRSSPPMHVVPFPTSATTLSPMTQPSHDLSILAPEAEVAARLASDGNILESLGEAEDFASIAAYANQLAQLIGSSLGMTGFSEMEFDFKTSKCLIVVSKDGEVIAVKPKSDALITKIREKITLLFS